MKNWLALFSILILFASFSEKSNAQNIELVNPSLTPADAVEEVLLGAGIEAFNITFNGSPTSANQPQAGVKEFTYDGGAFPMSHGILMQTASAPSVNNDQDLRQISNNGSVTNGSIIEFDFIPSGDTLSFDYIFASTEYSGYTCSSFNDAFGFFISGPGISGPFTNGAVNIATIPGTTIPVAINTVNSGSPSSGYSASNCANANPNWQSDAMYWTNSYNGTFSSSSFSSYNGATVILSANSGLICGEVYHIKLGIANVGDQSFDSGVFLAANSFSSPSVDIDIVIESSISDSVLIEGCSVGTINFTRFGLDLSDSLDVFFTVSGTATQGEDYDFLVGDGDSVITFLPGENSISLTVNPIQDGITEGLESVIISAFTVNICGDTIFSEGTIWIDDEPYSIVTSLDTLVLCAQDSLMLWAFTENGFPPYEYTWSNEEIGDTIPVSVGPENGIYEFIVTSKDACDFEYVDTAVVILNQTLAIDTMIQTPSDCGMMTGTVLGIGSGITGDEPIYIWTNSIVDTIPGDTIYSDSWQNLPGGWYYFSIEDEVCKVMDSVLVEQLSPPSAGIDGAPTSGNSPLEVNFSNESDEGDYYIWDLGNGLPPDTTYTLSEGQSAMYIDEGIYTASVTVVKGACFDTDFMEVEVFLPVEYITPNVFTPNGDGQNAYFHLGLENVSGLRIVILNRWGNVVHEFETYDETEALNFKWDGKTKSGAKAEDGVYFYKFTVIDHAGRETDGHGFVHIIR